MEIVELRVQVEDSQLKKLQADVQALKGTTINLGTGAGGGGKSGDPTSGVRAGLKATEQQANKTGQSMLSVMGKVAKWTAVTTAVYAPIKAFKAAIDTIKALDTEMVNVQKVTGATAQQMKQYQEQAYSLASEYGRSVTDVAQSMTAFARAGYGDKLGQMAELSTLLQNVGYVSEETADSMLLAVDAAWHLNGSQTELMAVLDGVDKITNQNATDFDKMARGMTVAASVFAESGESIQTFAAMVGTGTAVTQRSGEEISRGLRTIMMNIRQIKGETEDGELIDGESIAKASAALKEFAGISTMENGELRKASDVLGDLAAKWKDLDSVQQSAIAEALAGKRQANILTALMGNWDMYEKQMEEYATAAGTALRENEIYMDSWAAKTEQLKSTWTEFVSGFVNTDMVKGALDGLIGVVEFLDSGLGQAAIKIAAISLAISGLGKVFGAIASSGAIAKLVELFQMFATFGAADTFGLLAASIGPLGIAIAGLAAILATPAIVDFFTTDFEEQGQKISELKGEYEELYGAESEYQALIEKRSSDEGLTDWEQRRLDYLEQYRSELKATIEAEKEIAASKYQEEYGHQAQSTFDEDYYRNGGRGKKDNETIDVKNLREAKKAFEDLNEAASAGQKSQREYQEGIDEILATYEDFYNATKQGLDEGWLDTSDLTKAQQDLMELYETMMKLRDVPLDKLDVAFAIENFKGIAEVGDKSVVNWQKLKKVMEEAGASAEDIQATLDSMKQDESIILIDVEADGAEETLEKIESIGLAVQDADGWKINIDGLAQLLTDLGMSKDQIMQVVESLGEINGVTFVDAEGNLANLAAATANAGSSIANIIDGIKKKADALGATKPNIKISATDMASSVAKNVSGAVKSIPRSVSVSITANAGPALAAINTAKAALSAFKAVKAAVGAAGGATNWKGGPVLLGDEISPDGSPRPELVITKGGKAFVAGMSGPTMADLPSGARVYKYSDTKDIFSGRDMTEVQAFGAGNDKILNHYLNPTPAASSSGSSGGSSGGGSKTGSSGTKSGASSGGSKKSSSGSSKKSGGSSKSSGGSSGSSDGTDATLENLKKELELLQAQYSLLEAQNATTGELSAKSQEIQGKLHQINERLRATNGEQKDIVDNSTAWVQEQTKQIQLRENDLELLRAEYELLEESGADTESLRKKSKEIQDKLHEINKLLKETKGSQKDIAENSTAWLQEQKKIQEVQKGIYESERELLQTESTLLEKQDKSAGSRISKLKQIQDNLHREANYLRSIKADQAEINELSIEWLNIQDQILQIQQDLLDELDGAINAKLKEAAKERDRSIKVLDDEISRIQKERELQEDQLAIEEKRKAVEEARFALENAQMQRTVRYYNAKTGQWEWGADARTLKSSEESYRRSVEEYEKYKQDREYDLRIAALEAEKEDINRRYDALEEQWTSLSESFAEPLRDIKDILADLLETGRLTAKQIGSVQSLVAGIVSYQASAMSPGAYASYVQGWMSEHPGADDQAIGDAVLKSSGAAVAAVYAADQAIKTAGLSRDSDSEIKEGGAAAAARAAIAKAVSGKTYDSGGVLSGLGGVKATSEDEIVIPPDLASYMLKPSANSRFKQRMAELGYLYGDGRLSTAGPVGDVQNRSSHDHYGDVYQYGNITLSEGQAKSMTVYDLAQMSRGLRVYSAG